jgi:hypothetical protein
MPDDLLRSIWSSRLPSHIRAALAGQPEGDFDTAFRCEDRIIKAAPQPTLARVAPPHNNNDPWECRRSSPPSKSTSCQAGLRSLQLQEPPLGQQIPLTRQC